MTTAPSITVNCFGIELDNGENLKDLGVGNLLELDAPAGGLSAGSWRLVAYHGDFQGEATLDRVTAAEIQQIRQQSTDQLKSIFTPSKEN